MSAALRQDEEVCLHGVGCPFGLDTHELQMHDDETQDAKLIWQMARGEGFKLRRMGLFDGAHRGKRTLLVCIICLVFHLFVSKRYAHNFHPQYPESVTERPHSASQVSRKIMFLHSQADAEVSPLGRGVNLR